MMAIKSCYIGILLLTACAVLAHCAREPAMPTDQFADNPDDKTDDTLAVHKRPAFFVGSRYGRSDGGISQRSQTTKTRRVIIVPRNERFFLGPRYGKRNGEYMSPYEQDAFKASFDEQAVADATTNTHASINNKLNGNDDSAYGNTDNSNNNQIKMPQFMTCMYAGIKDYYRCSTVHGINNLISQMSSSHSDAGNAIDESN